MTTSDVSYAISPLEPFVLVFDLSAPREDEEYEKRRNDVVSELSPLGMELKEVKEFVVYLGTIRRMDFEETLVRSWVGSPPTSIEKWLKRIRFEDASQTCCRTVNLSPLLLPP